VEGRFLWYNSTSLNDKKNDCGIGRISRNLYAIHSYDNLYPTFHIL
jgi:hypothetical protein